jgi:diacylglycerol kinase family enzyme
MSGGARRLWAGAALLTGIASVTVAAVVLWNNWAALLGALVAVVVATMAVWYVLTRHGVARVVAGLVALGALVVALGTLLRRHSVAGIVVVLLLAIATATLARVALRTDRMALRTESPPGRPVGAARHPVLILNPRSGGGKADPRFADTATARGIETVTLEPGDDLETLARDAIGRGADVIGMAGGDGSQALVAGVAAEHDVPFVCIPAGTRNHFALDLGVDRDDLAGALDAFADSYERTVDLARVNGRVFVNNVSFGVYAAIVQSDEYREAKLGTTAKMLPELLGPGYDPFDFDLDGPPGVAHARPDLILVSNNRYKLDGVGGIGTRERLDEGVLGVIVIDVKDAASLAQLVTLSGAGRGSAYSGWHEWTAPALEIRSGKPVDAGIDGEAVTLDPPVHLEVVPGALRIRIAPHHPGVSPAAIAGTMQRGGPRRLVRIVLGRDAAPPPPGTAG